MMATGSAGDVSRRNFTMEDVAAAAGVSRTSVSRVMLNQGKVSDETRRRVREAAAHLGYVPNVMASELASRGSRSVGLLLRNAANPAYGLLHALLQGAAHDAGLTMVSMTVTIDDRERHQVASLDRLIGMRVAGLIVATGGVTSEQLEPFSSRIPIMRAGRPETTERLHAVSYDEEDNARQLAEHVASRGHTEVAVMVTEESQSYPEFVRGITMASVLEGSGVNVRRVPVVAPQDGADLIVALARRGEVTAAMCPTDMRQLGLLRALHAAGLRVPEDISVSGCDGLLPGADLLGLTTLRLPVEELAHRTISHMALLIGEHPPEGIVHEKLAGTMVPGRTVGPPPPPPPPPPPSARAR